MPSAVVEIVSTSMLDGITVIVFCSEENKCYYW